MAYGDGPADEALRTAWHAFCDKLKEAGDKVFKDANPAAPIMRADGFRFLTQNLGQAFPLALETKDPAYPQIHYFTHPTMKLGGDVCDFVYRQAWISGEHTYRITGRKGTARWFNLTVQGPKPEKSPGTDHAPLHEPFGDIPEKNILGSQIKTDGDGNFELFIGGPERPENWVPTTPGSRKLFIREAYDAWFEQPTTLVDRAGRHGRPQAAAHAPNAWSRRSTGRANSSTARCATGPITAGRLRAGSAIRTSPTCSPPTRRPTPPTTPSAGAWRPTWCGSSRPTRR